MKNHQNCLYSDKSFSDSDEEYARKYWEYTLENPDRYRPILDLINILPGENVLDIGGGPGTLAIPCAEHGANVTVVEPSEGMVKVLEQNLAERNIHNIDVIRKRWEDVSEYEIGKPFDHVIACLSLNFPDIDSALGKMCKLCRGRVYIVCFCNTPPWEKVLEDLWLLLHNKIYSSVPKSDILIKIIKKMEVSPNISYIQYKFKDSYTSFQEIVYEYANRLNITSDHERSLINSYLMDKISYSNNYFSFTGEVKQMMIWWDSNNLNSS